MSSFQKISTTRSTTTGTKLKNNLPYVSSGIPSLDHVTGGGIPTGSIFLIEEDILGSYSRILSKYFLAEGVVCKHALLVASADENPKDIVAELPQPCATSVNDKEVPPANSEMKIAWRYENLGQVESSFGSNTNFGHHFDLSKHIDEDTIAKSNITYCYLESEGKTESGFKNKMYHDLLTVVNGTLSNEVYGSNNKNGNILRLCVQSLGSPMWTAVDCDNSTSSAFGHDLLKFIYCLRVIVRDKNAVALITIPTHLFEDEHFIKRIHYSVDNAVKIESFAGSSRETNPVYSEYHGLFHVTKLSAIYSLVPYVPPSLDLAFKLRRKKFVIEKLHLPPELQESSEREQDDITAIPKTCGGFKKKDIDF